MSLLRRSLLPFSFVIFTLAGCSSVGGGLSSLQSVLQNIGGLSQSIGKFQSMASGLPSLDQLKQVSGFSDQAGTLGKALQGAASAAPPAAQGGVTKVSDLLGQLGGQGFKLDSLKALAPADLTSKVNEFTGLGKSLGSATDSLMGLLK